jgi:DNA-directed RNA polymerase subunit H (RpoH/RPB5)
MFSTIVLLHVIKCFNDLNLPAWFTSYLYQHDSHLISTSMIQILSLPAWFTSYLYQHDSHLISTSMIQILSLPAWFTSYHVIKCFNDLNKLGDLTKLIRKSKTDNDDIKYFVSKEETYDIIKKTHLALNHAGNVCKIL